MEEIINDAHEFKFNRDDVQNDIVNWAFTYIGPKFTFREYQLETITDIVMNVLEDINHTQIIEAPTGSGKSLINIIAAGVLATVYDKSSYILCSDLFLWKQYEDFVNEHPMIKKTFGILKGQTGNYECSKNGEDMRNADCRMAGISWAKMFNGEAADKLGYSCARFCPYVKARKKAIKSKVTIMTYALYHFQINVNAKLNPESCFKQRDTIFCDECHNIPQIVSNNFTPEVKYSDWHNFETIYGYKGNIQMDLFDEFLNPDGNKKPEVEVELISKIYKLSQIQDRYNNIWDIFVNEFASKQENQFAQNDYFELLMEYLPTIECIESNLVYKKQVLHQHFTKEDTKLYKSCSWFRNSMCFWNDFNLCLKHTGQEYIIKEIEDNRLLGEKVVKFRNAKEDFLSWYFLLDTAHNQVMLSATIGGYEAFGENVGIKYLEEKFTHPDEEIQFTVIPSTFNFDKSPIHFLNRFKMSYKEKEASLTQLKPIIYNMCMKQFPNERGMIQTGSYANAKEIYNNAPKELQQRMLLYNNSKEKTNMITLHQMSNNTILIGPTLVEGIDLPGDQCRFIVILKVPFPVIVDDYVKKKLELFPKWYNSTTSNIIIQGIGRGNRFKDDYCTTYILDACFLGLYNATKEQYPKELQNRIKIYT